MSVNVTLDTILKTLVYYPYPIETNVYDQQYVNYSTSDKTEASKHSYLDIKTIDIREYAWKSLKIYENDMFNLQEENQQLRREVQTLKENLLWSKIMEQNE